MKRFVAAAAFASLILVAACSDSAPSERAAAAPEAVANAYDQSAPRERAQAGGSEAPRGGALLAYSYQMSVLAPKAAVEPMMAAHERRCVEAGLDVCQVLSASTHAWGEDEISASLALRAEPSWLAAFRADIVVDASQAGGRLASNNVQAEDLTAQIVDLDARLEAKKALRERIDTLLKTSEGSLSDILAAERALADVQGEIDSMTASLAAARARVDMSMLSISYSSDPDTSVGFFKPLTEAFRNFGRTSVESLARAVDFVAGAWPFFIVLLGVLAILRLWWRGRRKKA